MACSGPVPVQQEVEVIDLTDDFEETKIVPRIWTAFLESFATSNLCGFFAFEDIPNLNNRFMMKFVEPVAKSVKYLYGILKIYYEEIATIEMEQYLSTHAMDIVYLRSILGLKNSTGKIMELLPLLQQTHLIEMIKPLIDIAAVLDKLNFTPKETVLLMSMATIHSHGCELCQGEEHQAFLKELWKLWPGRIPLPTVRNFLDYVRKLKSFHDERVHKLRLTDNHIKEIFDIFECVFNPQITLFN